jgi:spermidine synthase
LDQLARSPSSVARIADDDGRHVLLANGVIQSVAPENALAWGSYWAAMVPPFAPRRALVLGLGGATLPHLIVHRWGSAGTLVGVDDDAELLTLVRDAGWLNVRGLEPVCADAFAFVESCVDRFDYVAVDLYRGDAFPRRVLGRHFLQRLAALLDPPAWLCVNVYGPRVSPSSLASLRKLFAVRHEVKVGDNVVIHASLNTPNDARS